MRVSTFSNPGYRIKRLCCPAGLELWHLDVPATDVVDRPQPLDVLRDLCALRAL